MSESNGQHNDLTPKQLRFVQEYLIDLNATAAYIRAGYTATGNSAEAAASRLLRNVKILDAIAKERAKAAKKTEITVSMVLEKLMQKAEMDNTAGVRAVELIGQHLGMWPNESKITLNMTDEQRVSRLNAILEQARARRGGEPSGNGEHS